MTLYQCFKRHVTTRPDEPFFGTRPQIDTNETGPVFGDYEWESYRDVNADVENLARGMIAMNLNPEVDGEDKKWRFVGIWSKNRSEWPKI